MDDALLALARWGYVILAAFVVAEQVPLPVPAIPVLLGIGALAADGRMSITVAIVTACAAAVPVDLIWRRLGAVRGVRALHFMCRLSREPQSCIQRAETLFERYGSRLLLVAKFVPGLTALAPALAGLVNVPLARFLTLDVAGVVLWAGTWLSLGYLFSGALELLAAQVSRAGGMLGALAGAFVIMYVLLKVVRQRRVLRELRTARITVAELKALLDRGHAVWIADLRSALEVAEFPYTIPGAQRVAAETMPQALAEIPRDRQIVLVCT